MRENVILAFSLFSTAMDEELGLFEVFMQIINLTQEISNDQELGQEIRKLIREFSKED